MILILGADDGEMLAIERLAKLSKVELFYAADASGRRVVPAAAYEAVALLDERGALFTERTHDIPDIVSNSIVVECDFPGCSPRGRCDHHRPGDRGFGKPPSEYWDASSVGQVATLLGIKPSEDLRIAAAADHCLAAAYAGQCPGVDPSALAEYRIRELCSISPAGNRSQLRLPKDVCASIKRAKAAILSAPNITVGIIPVKDLRGQVVSDLPEAAMILGVAYLAGGASLRQGDAPKIVLGGCGKGSIPGTAPVEAFLAAAHSGEVGGMRVKNAYGDPVRGFAGAYLCAY